jgi:hypothetical protein
MVKLTGVIAVAFVTVLIAPLLMGQGHALDKRAANFEGKDTLLRPEGYREWIFVGSSLGLRYDEKADKKTSEELDFKNIYINPGAYREYQKTGRFPQGTVLVLETAAAQKKNEPGLQGSFQKEFSGISVAVKDRERFEDEWAYFHFNDKPGKPADKTQPLPKAACYDCHRKKAAQDNVFTQFYPVLRAIRKK